VDTGAEASRLIGATGSIGQGAEHGFRPLVVWAGMLNFSGYNAWDRRIALSKDGAAR
jgi:hypothetical protein